ncbi:MAG: glycosyltransferase family 4 protein [Fimbriimonadales bacterium]|nr:glycosyltransferase family 4 protein [Fimbriimonadales bacterium]
MRCAPNRVAVRIVMLSWEYPPRIVGGIARHVQELSEALAAQGTEVHVITATHPDAPDEAVENGVYLHRAGAPPPPHGDFLGSVYGMNAAFEARADALLSGLLRGKPARQRREAILLHAHDWLALPAAKALKHRYKLPLIATIHATEYGRHGGIHSDLSRAISHIEWELSYEAWRVIVCSEFMRGEVIHALSVPYDKIDVIPNGTRAEKFQFEFPEAERAAFRARFAQPEQPLLFFVGRMVREKGVQILLQAMPIVRAEVPHAKLIVVGGGYRAHLEEFVRFCHLESAVQFTGFIPDADLLKLYRVVDVAIYPSLYEPFGIVALEAMAAGAPVVVSDAGGLKEVVRHEETGIVTWAGNAESLAWGILRVLQDPAAARRRVQNALKAVQREFNWRLIAKRTAQVYRRVWAEFKTAVW